MKGRSRKSGRRVPRKAIRVRRRVLTTTTATAKGARGSGKRSRKPRAKTVVESRRTWKRGLVFVAMALERRKSASIFRAIQNACETLELKCERSDTQVGSPPVVDAIKQLIQRAEYLVFDLSYERPNVYYELGYAHGVGNRATDLLLVAGHGSTIHFDTAALHVRFYKNYARLEEIVREGLEKMMASSRKRKTKRGTSKTAKK